MKEKGLYFEQYAKQYAKVLSFLVKSKGYEEVSKGAAQVREGMIASSSLVIERLPSLFKECYFYIFPITEDTKVLKGIIVDAEEKDDETIYYFVGEDGEIYNDDDETVMGSNFEEVERILKELQQDM